MAGPALVVALALLLLLALRPLARRVGAWARARRRRAFARQARRLVAWRRWLRAPALDGGGVRGLFDGAPTTVRLDRDERETFLVLLVDLDRPATISLRAPAGRRQSPAGRQAAGIDAELAALRGRWGRFELTVEGRRLRLRRRLGASTRDLDPRGLRDLFEALLRLRDLCQLDPTELRGPVVIGPAGGEAVCPYCKERAALDLVTTCPACRTPHHAGCFEPVKNPRVLASLPIQADEDSSRARSFGHGERSEPESWAEAGGCTLLGCARRQPAGLRAT